MNSKMDLSDLELSYLDVTLHDRIPQSTGYETVRLKNGTRDHLDISFRRTIRVPDNGKAYALPPDCGAFPVYSVNDYSKRLPQTMVAKGGVLIPIHQREAMWINFESSIPFAVKVYVGGINAVSGEPTGHIPNSDSKRTRYKALQENQEPIQDYVVTGTGDQQWLDGIAKQDGGVMQFVAAPTCSGYSVESQITGQDNICGIQIEVVPMKQYPTTCADIVFFVILPTGEKIAIKANQSSTVRKLKKKLFQLKGIPPDHQRFFVDGDRLLDEMKLADCQFTNNSVVYLSLPLIGGCPRPVGMEAEAEMTIAPGGIIKQAIVRDTLPSSAWEMKNSIMFNLQLLNAEVFEDIVGIKPPPTPISAATYAKHNYPFLTMYEEATGIKGNFSVQSIAQLKAKGPKTGKVENRARDDDKSIKFREVVINRPGILTTFSPVDIMGKESREVNILDSV